jgi:hypothetical protein
LLLSCRTKTVGHAVRRSHRLDVGGMHEQHEAQQR